MNRRLRGEPTNGCSPQISPVWAGAASPGGWPGPVIFLAVGLSYLGLAQFVLFLNDPVNLGAGFWPAAGVTIAALLLLPTRRWGWVICAVVVAELGGDLAHGYPLVASLGWAAGNAIEPVVGASLVRRFVHPAGSLVPLRCLMGFLALGVIVGPLVGASIGSMATVGVIGLPFWQVWPKFVLGDALGVLVVAPALLSLRTPFRRRGAIETFALALSLVVVSSLVFRDLDPGWGLILPYLVVPLQTWAALRFGMRGAAWAVLWVTQVANWATATSYGPFSDSAQSAGHAVTLLQLYLAIATISALILAALVNDLRDRDDVAESLRHQAHHDALTGLPNRALLQDRVMRALARDRQDGRQLALLLCDLDGFKVINDGLGHQAGDEVLVELAIRLRNCARPGDTVARLSGDEFVILVHGVDPPGIDAIGERIMRAVAYPVEISGGQRVTTSMSIGVAVAEPGDDSHRLLRDADAALYRAKDLGRGRLEHFNEALRVQALERLSIPQELQVGLERGELHCVFQPEVHLDTGALFGFEALVRWKHPRRPLLGPGRFVPIIEEAGLEPALFVYVLGQALDAQQQWFHRLGFRPRVSVNVSPRQLERMEVVEVVASAMARRGVSPGDLLLEVTETAVAHDSSSATLLALHDLGVRLAIDDFGTGWSSMKRLSSFPWDALKIDQSFVAGLLHDPQAEHLIRATIVMAHALGVQVIAEGVETADQLELLASLDCDIVQGYLVGHPLDAAGAIHRLDGERRWMDLDMSLSGVPV